jgi:hypothetical protein
MKGSLRYTIPDPKQQCLALIASVTSDKDILEVYPLGEDFKASQTYSEELVAYSRPISVCFMGRKTIILTRDFHLKVANAFGRRRMVRSAVAPGESTPSGSAHKEMDPSGLTGSTAPVNGVAHLSDFQRLFPNLTANRSKDNALEQSAGNGLYKIPKSNLASIVRPPCRLHSNPCNTLSLAVSPNSSSYMATSPSAIFDLMIASFASASRSEHSVSPETELIEKAINVSSTRHIGAR